MKNTINEILLEPSSGLSYRIQHAQIEAVKAPCLILLHGVGANETGFIELATQMDPRFSVVLVRAPLEFGPMQFGWFQVSFTANGPSINAQQASQSRQKLIQFIEHLPNLYPVDSQHIYIAGFSQGGIMSASVGLTAVQKVAGFGILSGRILPEVLPEVQPSAELETVDAFISHGVLDQKLGIHFARNAKDVLQGLNVPLEYHEYQADHCLNAQMIADFKLWLAAQLS